MQEKFGTYCALLVQIGRKHTLFCTQFSAQNVGNHILGHPNFEIFKEYRPQTPLEEEK